MKKSLKKVFFTLICTLCFSLNVFAVSSPFIEGEGEDTYGLKSKYNNFSKTSISEANTTVTLYGKSECDGSKCTLTYSASNNSSFKDALAKAITCSNGENNITYQITGASGNTEFKEDNKAKLNGTAYWDEDYSISCTTESSGSYVVNLNSESSSSSSYNSSNTDNSSSSTTGDSQSSTSDYSSSSTVSNEKTGVNTYFVVLGVVAIISYSFMICVKKFNLFKNI